VLVPVGLRAVLLLTSGTGISPAGLLTGPNWRWQNFRLGSRQAWSSREAAEHGLQLTGSWFSVVVVSHLETTSYRSATKEMQAGSSKISHLGSTPYSIEAAGRCGRQRRWRRSWALASPAQAHLSRGGFFLVCGLAVRRPGPTEQLTHTRAGRGS
jgi:hypothetical protein